MDTHQLEWKGSAGVLTSTLVLQEGQLSGDGSACCGAFGFACLSVV